MPLKGGEEVNIRQYLDKNVCISASNGKIFFGIIDDFFYADENNLGEESIVLQTKDGKLIEFTESDILEITIMSQ